MNIFRYFFVLYKAYDWMESAEAKYIPEDMIGSSLEEGSVSANGGGLSKS